MQSTETKPEPFSSLIYAIQNDLARQLLALAAEVENSDEHARLETDLMEDVGSALRNAADALTAERDRADRAEARLAQILEYAQSTYTASTVARRIVQMGKATA